jgi:hypothetical protein
LQNFNDFHESDQYTIGQKNKVIIQSIAPKGIIANLQLHQKKILQTEPKLLTLGKKTKAE